MTTEIQNHQAQRPQRPAPSPLSKGEVINELSACLALVRPVGMSDDAATEWLAVAAGEVVELATLRPVNFSSGCAQARRECTHHGQIVPMILKHEFYEWEVSLGYHRRGLKAICGQTEPRLTNQSEVQKLIEQTAGSLKV